MRKLYKIKLLVLIIPVIVITTSCTLKKERSFFENLSTYCGKSFTGSSTFPNDPNDSFANKELVIHFKDCSDKKIIVPFSVGDDRSRTWFITKTTKGLLLKHQHMNKDGTEDEVSQYGGYANLSGNSYSQFFEADAETAKMLPEAKTNVWNLEIKSIDNELIYYLERHNKPRFKAKFDLSKPR